ncbi:Enoyl-CoA hydratase/isomerase [Parvibaculum lavamentivorans DS-1]|uniref:Enoyl-CoA hydratase/isomerase n=1 Tax=Parvibaculum lavamentivorans (strain DS-1 / DSM 13023 / NCIMB 13966) TaxID=402881 RepID=A7HTS1_PARL1|nr:enoyl-CoA hydratase/isomerase family protein [Parvibaculum lavamentivorans]ABS63304.1 Enoyl-CoA hydratase/isomerase [Parvibaculum lavamentivorans DS-1]
MTDYKTLIIEKKDGVDWVTMNRPDALNAMNRQLVDDLQDYFGKLYTDHSVRVVVLRGAGRAFCAGLDLKERSNTPDAANGASPQAGLVSQRRISEIVMRMRRCPQPIISLVHGPACGGGFALALASDIRIAGKSARMNAAFIRIGLSACDIGVSYFLPRLVGVSVASELMMTGRFINAARAERVGLVSEVVEDDALEEAVKPYLEEMLTTSPLGLRLTKECLNMSVDAGSLEAAVAMEDRNQILCAQTNDFREGIGAFLGKRKPAFTNS